MKFLTDFGFIFHGRVDSIYMYNINILDINTTRFRLQALLPAILIISANGWPIRVNQPTAITTPATSINPSQIDYFLKHYPNEFPTRFTHPQAYLPDPDYTRASRPDPTLQSTTASTEQPSYYFEPTITPYPKQTEGYDFYFPQPENANTADYQQKDSYLYELQPPKQTSETNYYAVKPKKGTKKYNSQKKQVNHTGSGKETSAVSSSTATATGADGTDVEYNFEDYIPLNAGSAAQASHNLYVQQQPERLTPKSAIRTLRQEELNTGEYLPSILRNGNDNQQRVEFQMHGFNGPESYQFGYDTGKG